MLFDTNVTIFVSQETKFVLMGTKIKNQLKFLVMKIATEKLDDSLLQTIVDELALECDVNKKSVQRWLRNDSQPTSSMLPCIISVLKKHSDSINVGDFFVSSSVSKSVALCVARHKQFVK